MNKLIALLTLAGCALVTPVGAATYSTEATMSLQKEEGTYSVDVRVSHLSENNGKPSEQLIAQPRILSAPGVPASLYQGPKPHDVNYTKQENVTADVSWPYPNESGVALCSVVVKLGDTIVSKSKFQLKLDGPGRTPLIVRAEDIDPKSVRVEEKDKSCYVLLEFRAQTKEAVKKLANENYGNKVRIQDLQGGLTEGSLSFGTYKETGMALHCETKEAATRMANILRGENSK